MSKFIKLSTHPKLFKSRLYGSSLSEAGLLYGPAPTLVTAAACTRYISPAVRFVSSSEGEVALTVTFVSKDPFSAGPPRTTICKDKISYRCRSLG